MLKKMKNDKIELFGLARNRTLMKARLGGSVAAARSRGREFFSALDLDHPNLPILN